MFVGERKPAVAITGGSVAVGVLVAAGASTVMGSVASSMVSLSLGVAGSTGLGSLVGGTIAAALLRLAAGACIFQWTTPPLRQLHCYGVRHASE
jgi:hypothetical protein